MIFVLRDSHVSCCCLNEEKHTNNFDGKIEFIFSFALRLVIRNSLPCSSYPWKNIERIHFSYSEDNMSSLSKNTAYDMVWALLIEILGAIHWTKFFGNSGTKSNGTESFRKLVSKILVNFWRLSSNSGKSEFSENPVPFANLCSGPVFPNPEIDKIRHGGHSSCSTLISVRLVFLRQTAYKLRYWNTCA